jgi:hypothetical protein
MSDTSGTIPTSALGSMWQCTGELRWLSAPPPMLSANIEDADAIARLRTMPPGSMIHLRRPLAPTVSLAPRLQQRWVCIDGPGEEWRDVPTVDES